MEVILTLSWLSSFFCVCMCVLLMSSILYGGSLVCPLGEMVGLFL